MRRQFYGCQHPSLSVCRRRVVDVETHSRQPQPVAGDRAASYIKNGMAIPSRRVLRTTRSAAQVGRRIHDDECEPDSGPAAQLGEPGLRATEDLIDRCPTTHQ